MKDVQRATMPALRAAGLNGDAIIHDLWTRRKIDTRMAAGFYHHVDYMSRTRKAWLTILEIVNNNPNWIARPGVLEFFTRGVLYYFAMSFFTLNHSVIVASMSYEIVTPRIVNRGRGVAATFEQDLNGRWRPGHHKCLHTFDAIELRPGGANNQYRDGHAKVLLAEQLANAIDITPSQPLPVDYQVIINTQRDPLRVRRGAGTNHSIMGDVARGTTHRIIAESNGQGADLWGKLPVNHPQHPNGWIALDMTRRVVPPPPPVEPITHGFSVQVVASRDMIEVQNTLNRLTQLGYKNAYPAHGNGHYRARVGVYPTHAEAAVVLEKLVQQGFRSDAWIVRY